MALFFADFEDGHFSLLFVTPEAVATNAILHGKIW